MTFKKKKKIASEQEIVKQSTMTNALVFHTMLSHSKKKTHKHDN